MNRQATMFLMLASALVGLVPFVGCEPGDGIGNSADFGSTAGSNNSAPLGQMVSTSGAQALRAKGQPLRTQQNILIASFNIQAFGKKKLADPWVIGHIVSLIRLFDVVAIQEVRAEDQTTLPTLIKMINANGARYDYLLGPRLGRSVSKEQYAYIYDTARVVSGPDAVYTIEDDADLLHREPLVARFVTRVQPGVRPFSFSLVNMHTDPDEVKTEIPVMHTVLKGIREFEYYSAREDDVILMGDLNAGPKQFGELGRIPGIFWTVDNEPTNTIRKSIYDNIIFDRDLTNEFTGNSGVLDVCELFGIKVDGALRISDHLPIWAEFTIGEQDPGASTQFVESNSRHPVRR